MEQDKKILKNELVQKEFSKQKNPKSIKNVWQHNVEEEMAKVSNLIDEGYTWIAMDTEFPGILYNYVIENNSAELGYRMLKMNVDSLKLIQAGITLSKENGEKPKGTHTWQFNISFDLEKEKFHPESIKLLKTAGIDFEVMLKDGIDVMVFSDLLMSSGLVINPNVYWITFHGTYDFSYLLKVLINNELPQTSKEFLKYLGHVFPNIYDIKTMINELEDLKNYSLQKLGQEMSIIRRGIQHQAGSDALLTLELFFEIVRVHFQKGIPNKYYNNIFGISNEGSFLNYQGNEAMMHNFSIYPYFQGYQQYFHDGSQFQLDNTYYQNQYMQGMQGMQNIQGLQYMSARMQMSQGQQQIQGRFPRN